MGRFSVPLAPRFADFAGVQAGSACSTSAAGPERRPPSSSVGSARGRRGGRSVRAFFAAARDRYPGVDVHHAPAEQVPFEDDEFDAALAQLVVHFMSDPVRGVREMARVTRSGGVVAACVWDHAGGRARSVVLAGGPRARSRTPSEARPRRARVPGSSTRALRAAGLRDRRGGPIRRRRARHVRGVVGAVHARRRPGRCLRCRPRRAGATSCASGAGSCCRRRRSRSTAVGVGRPRVRLRQKATPAA